MLSRLPDDMIGIVLSHCTRTCPECTDGARHPTMTTVKCRQCRLHVCRRHARVRFVMDDGLCNSCFYWEHGYPAAAYGMHD